MDAVMNATLTKWGNRQGFRVPKEACDLLGVDVGARAKMVVDPVNSQLLITFEQPKRKFQRTVNDYPLHVRISDNDADVRCGVCVEQTRAVDLSARPCKWLGELSVEDMNEVLNPLGSVFGI